jgi:pimeloyl-ACP methyl ester carboxylesterase
MVAPPKIHIERHGSGGVPLVFLHGVGRNGSDFAPLRPWLADRTTVTWDHRGHGLSDRAASYRVVDYASDLIHWLDQFEAERVDLYGHSLGALVALRTASERPDRVRGLVLEDPPSPEFLGRLPTTLYCHNFPTMQRLAGSTAAVEAIAAELAEVRLGPAADAARLGDVRDAAALRFGARCLQSVDPAVFTPLLAGQWFDGYDFYAAAAAVRGPTLLLRGDVDCGGMLPESDARRLVAQLHNVADVRFTGAGHLLHWQRIEETVRVLLAFLESQ